MWAGVLANNPPIAENNSPLPCATHNNTQLPKRPNLQKRKKNMGWCVGNNPPFVACGIQLSGLPAPSGRFLISDRLPFPLAGQPFHRSHKA